MSVHVGVRVCEILNVCTCVCVSTHSCVLMCICVCMCACFCACVCDKVRTVPFLCVWMLCLHVCLRVVGMPGDHRAQKRMSDPLELKLYAIVSHSVGAGN